MATLQLLFNLIVYHLKRSHVSIMSITITDPKPMESEVVCIVSTVLILSNVMKSNENDRFLDLGGLARSTPRDWIVLAFIPVREPGPRSHGGRQPHRHCSFWSHDPGFLLHFLFVVPSSSYHFTREVGPIPGMEQKSLGRSRSSHCARLVENSASFEETHHQGYNFM